VNRPVTSQEPTVRSGVFHLDRAGKISLIMLIVIVGFVASVFYHYALGTWLGHPYPDNTPLFIPRLIGTDFTDNLWISRDLNPYLGVRASNYYPVANMIFYVCSVISGPGHATRLFLAYSFLAVAALAWFSFAHLKAGSIWKQLTSTFVFTFMTYPVLFALDRGNIEILLLFLVFLFVHFFQRRRFLMSSVFLALAVTMKLYPLFLVVLFVPEKKYREIGLTIALSVALTLACLVCFKGGFFANLEFLLAGKNVYSASAMGMADVWLGNSDIVQRGVTLFTVIKVLLIETGTLAGVNMARLMNGYVVAAVATAILVAGYVIFIERELWKRVALLVIAMLLLQQLAADYKVIHLLIPLFLFVNSTKMTRVDPIYALIFGLLLIPKDYYLLPKTVSELGVHDISISILLNPAIMLLMASMIIVSGLRRWRGARRQRHPCASPVEQGFAGR
jgi:hypothetical protein